MQLNKSERKDCLIEKKFHDSSPCKNQRVMIEIDTDL